MAQISKNGILLAAAGAGAVLATRAIVNRVREYSLKDKTVLITGGSRGLGLVMAREFAEEGAKIAICARDPNELDRALADLRGRGATAFGFPCDVTDRAQVNEMVRLVRDKFGSIDVLVNNAGVIQVGPFETMTLEDYEQAMDVHFWGPLYTTLAVVPEMIGRGEGRIVNVTSIGGKVSVPHLLPYSASKFAAVGFSQGLHADLAKDGISVTTVCPGLMRTGSPRNATFKGQHKLEYAWFAISDSLPVTSVSAENAARQIVEACKKGQAELVISVPAKIAVIFHGLFPGITADMMGLVNRLLPGPGGIGTKRAKGKESESPLAPSVLTTLSEQAARRNNEISGQWSVVSGQ
jgi:NAD(P)-dependent dehydrogenase (short-subunit alcohol dehydrogenase family)